MNPNFRPGTDGELAVRLEMACPEAELDEQWSYVGGKSNQRWLWYAVDHTTNTILAYVFGKRKDTVFEELKALLEPFGIRRFYTDDWGGLPTPSRPGKPRGGQTEHPENRTQKSEP